MSSALRIGDFAVATFLSKKTLRHYHKIGLLEPAQIDPDTGYRNYGVEQIATAQIIRRLRDIDMPLEHIRDVLAAPDLDTRSRLMHAHLVQLESALVRTQEAVSSLRQLLDEAPSAAAIRHRHLPETPAAMASTTVDLLDALPWVYGALGEIKATLSAQGITPAGHPVGIFANDLYAQERGTATVFVPCDPLPRPAGRVTTAVLPAVDLATIEHAGTHADIDRAYGALAAHVAQHAIGIDGPVHERYIVSPTDNPDPSQWRTEIGWPIFPTRG